jgi:cysteine desulfurase
MKERYYFDWAATAVPDHPLINNPVSEAAFPFGNPSSRHTEGRIARDILEDARTRSAAVLGLPAKHIYFTSGGTEANALVLFSLLFKKNGGREAFLYSRAEHPSIRENAKILERLGKNVIPVGVEQDGRVSASGLERALEKTDNPSLAAIMGVNNETGAVTDILPLTALLRKRPGKAVHFHCDMVQGTGKIPSDLGGWDVDSASLSAHKLGGPRGIGLLYLRKPIQVLYSGGGQEGGIRPGTENVAGAAALADCLERRARPEKLRADYAAAASRFKGLIEGLKSFNRCSLIPEDRGAEDGRFSPYILQTAFDGIPGEVMVRALDDAGFAVSTGSACSGDKKERPVLDAMGVDERKSLFGIRISQGWSTTEQDTEALLEAIKDILKIY